MSNKRVLLGLATIVALVAGVISGCVAAAPGEECDRTLVMAGTDGHHVLGCPFSASATWEVVDFNEEPMTVERLLELLKLAAGPPVEVERVAVLGDDYFFGVTAADPSPSNIRPFSVSARVEWSPAPSGRPCNPVSWNVEPMLVDDPSLGDEVVVARVTWTERVGNDQFTFCPEPLLRDIAITDAKGDRVPASMVIA